LGYLPGSAKQASTAMPCTNFSIVRVKDGAKVFSGVATGPKLNPDTSEDLYTLDFSGVKESGEYRLHAEGLGNSPMFQIGPAIYHDPFRLVTRAMFLWRCGTAVSASHNGRLFRHESCHTNDASLARADFNSQGSRDGTGGWHDAGDYNKYVVNAGITVGVMLRAWEDFGPAIRRIRLDLPEGQGKLPEFLAEVKWETDWLLKMQNADGSVAHKVSTQKFGGFILPERELEQRYFTPPSTAAAADFVAMLSQASRCFEPHDGGYARTCLEAAKKAYGWLQAHPQNERANLAGFSTGAYQTGDADDRLWAAAELWQTTGDAEVLKDFETRLQAIGAAVRVDFDWGEVGNLGVITYVASRRQGRNEELLALSRTNFITTAERILKTRDAHGYARPLGTCTTGAAMVRWRDNRLCLKRRIALPGTNPSELLNSTLSTIFSGATSTAGLTLRAWVLNRRCIPTTAGQEVTTWINPGRATSWAGRIPSRQIGTTCKRITGPMKSRSIGMAP
jgi:endoglucanase